MNTYKITYWNNGNICVKEIVATDVNAVQLAFYLTTACDDIISIEEAAE